LKTISKNFAYPHSTGVSSRTHHLLASKSNYQHIVKGNLPQSGLSYLDHVLSKVIPKRKYHGAAERKCRNRMTNALQEIAELLPRGNLPAGAQNSSNSGAEDAGSRRQQAATKASTVEMAVKYIRSLQKEIVELTRKLGEKDLRQISQGHQNKAAWSTKPA
jgi:hypothetical protein